MHVWMKCTTFPTIDRAGRLSSFARNGNGRHGRWTMPTTLVGVNDAMQLPAENKRRPNSTRHPTTRRGSRSILIGVRVPRVSCVRLLLFGSARQGGVVSETR